MKDNSSRLGTEPVFQFYFASLAACGMHITYLITFSIFRMWLLAMFNIFSVLFYLVLGIISIKARSLKYALAWVVLFNAEVIVHAVLCTVMQGMDTAFFLLPLLVLPVLLYYLFVYCSRKVFFRTAGIMSIVAIATLAFMIIFSGTVGSVYSLAHMHELTGAEIMTLRTINIIFTFGTLMLFTFTFYTEVTRAMAQLRATNQKLNYIATHDALTGLSNRHSIWKFFDELENSREHYCIVLGDLDDFKKINDTYGHDCGDIVLKSVADVILSNMTEADIACRWGGEEMLIVMRGTRVECFERLERIKSEICSLDIVHENQPVRVTMTFGFAGSEEMTHTFETAELEVITPAATAARTHSHIGIESLISVVDKRLYVGKRNGKNVIIAA
ncbi:MAG: GGDEF domain-containing protein [Oscillospiraceae bacterium]|nr:GGDEF domain-containing protein [Oscillospiraceae bacterium]